MAFQIDPEILALTAEAPPRPIAARDDWHAIRERGDAALSLVDSLLPEHPEIVRTDHRTSSYDDTEILLRWYDPAPDRAGNAAVVYLHGGGMILGSVKQYDHYVAGIVAESGVPFLAVDYRVAPEHPHPTPVEDCFAGLVWLVHNADTLGVDPQRIAVMGDSAGGGLAAAVALLARDRDVAVSRQILVYPMLDDRTTLPDPALAPYIAWSYDDNYTGWHALLGHILGTDYVPASAAPARAVDVSHVAPAYIEVGELDIFRDEAIEYARRIAAAGTSIELHVHPGCPHGYDRIPGAAVGQRAHADRVRILRSL